ncbi:MAG: hypothetical protein ACLU98_13670, partial [Desulfovibrio fairfieldensis]
SPTGTALWAAFRSVSAQKMSFSLPARNYLISRRILPGTSIRRRCAPAEQRWLCPILPVGAVNCLDEFDNSN